MAKILGVVHYDPKQKKVVTTYQILRSEPSDKFQFVTKDSHPFLVQTTNARLIKRLGLQKVKNSGGVTDLYQVKQGPPPDPPKPAKPPGTGTAATSKATQSQLKCGTLNKQGQFVAWSSGWGPDPDRI